MGFTAAEKILMNHSVDQVKSVRPGDIITANVDFAGLHDGVGRTIDYFSGIGEMTGVFDTEKVGAFMSHHFCSGHNDELAANQKIYRDWCRNLGIPMYDFGSGICHIQVIERGIAFPGALIVFGDSHTPAYGAVGAISCQMLVEMPEVFLRGKIWFKVPETHKYIINGETKKGVYPRDVIQYIVKEVGLDASIYAVTEYDGTYIHSLPVPLRFPFTLMATEIGAKSAFIEPDDITLEYLKGRVKKPFTVVKDDPDAEIQKTFTFDVSNLEPQVCAPSSPDNTKPISETIGATIDQVCIGTCTGSSIYDMREAAKILKGRKVKARTLIVPGSLEVMQSCVQEGLVDIFIESGANIYPAFCGTCQTMGIGHLAPDETQMHSGPRNWPGRTADGSLTYLGSPATCAASAIEGKVADPRNYL